MATKVKIGNNLVDLLTINNLAVPKITSYDVQRPKLWSKNTGRDLSGTNKGTLIGVFTKIVVEVGGLTDNEYAQLSAILDKASMTVTFYDEKTKNMRTEKMYAGDITGVLGNSMRKNIKNLKFSLIGIYKR